MSDYLALIGTQNSPKIPTNLHYQVLKFQKLQGGLGNSEIQFQKKNCDRAVIWAGNRGPKWTQPQTDPTPPGLPGPPFRWQGPAPWSETSKMVLDIHDRAAGNIF